MTPDALLEDLEHRKNLAGELARYADGRQGLGLGTALAGLLALLDPVLIWLGSDQLVCYSHQHATRAHFWEFYAPLMALFITAIALVNAFIWLLLKDPLQVRLYRSHGEARSAMPAWEVRVGMVLLGVLGCVGFWIGGSVLLAMRVSPGPELSPASLWGVPMLKLVAIVALLGTAVLVAAAWRRVRGWRNWLGWTSLCAPFLFFASAPLLDNRHPSLFAVILQAVLFASLLYLPFLATFRRTAGPSALPAAVETARCPDNNRGAAVNKPEQLKAILDLDRLVHEPARLAILMVLSGAEWVEFKLLEELTRLTKGNLSSHLAKLEDAGYVVIDKGYRGKIPLTKASLTVFGRKALAEHWERLKRAAPQGRKG